MTDNEIVKALECCKKNDCDNCPNDFGNCYANLAGYALDLINRQKAEIKRLKKLLDEEEKKYTLCAKRFFKDGVKEVSWRLRSKLFIADDNFNPVVTENEINSVLKEMVGEEL